MRSVQVFHGKFNKPPTQVRSFWKLDKPPTHGFVLQFADAFKFIWEWWILWKLDKPPTNGFVFQLCRCFQIHIRWKLCRCFPIHLGWNRLHLYWNRFFYKIDKPPPHGCVCICFQNHLGTWQTSNTKMCSPIYTNLQSLTICRCFQIHLRTWQTSNNNLQMLQTLFEAWQTCNTYMCPPIWKFFSFFGMKLIHGKPPRSDGT